jgi:hypothetical protein
MILLAKAALAVSSTVVLAGVYTFHEGVMNISVDESRPGGTHMHLWLPAAVVPMAMHFVPREHLRHASHEAREAMPILRAALKELKKYPDADFVEVQADDQHVQVRTVNGKLVIDVTGDGEDVHVRCPLAMIEDVATQLETSEPGS